jgi:Cytochrome oxidase c assembly
MDAGLSPVDRFLVRGRRWADNMHRVTTIGLLGLAGVSAVVATYGLFGLVRHSRRQKRAFIEREMDRLYQAQQAFLRGEADAEQLHLLEQERAGDEMDFQRSRDKEKKKSEGIWAKTKGFIGMGAADSEMGTETVEEARVREMRNRGRDRVFQEAFVQGEVKPAAVEKSTIEGVGFDAKGRPVPINKMERVVRRGNEEEAAVMTGRAPGPLDATADNIADAVVPTKSNSGWLSWLRGNSS